MRFSRKLTEAMQKLNLNQVQVCGLTGKSKASISQYLSGKQTPPENVQSDIAVSLGLPADYFAEEDVPVIAKEALTNGRIKRMLPEEAAEYLGMDKATVRKGLQQGVFPWGYAIKTSDKRWVYFINANRFASIEGISV